MGLATVINIIGLVSPNYPALAVLIAYCVGLAVVKLNQKENQK